MYLAQGHNAVTPVRLETLCPSVLSQALYFWATALHTLCENNLYVSQH